MAKSPKVPHQALQNCALKMAELNGSVLSRIKKGGRGRASLWETPAGERVRLRTSNDRVLLCSADRSDANDPHVRLDIDGARFLLIAMPSETRTPGPVEVYLVPTEMARDAVLKAHGTWLLSNPNTKGGNQTFAVWFDGDPSNLGKGFAIKWAEHKLEGAVSSLDFEQDNFLPANRSLGAEGTVGDAIELSQQLTVTDVITAARERISVILDAPIEVVKIEVRIVS